MKLESDDFSKPVFSKRKSTNSIKIDNEIKFGYKKKMQTEISDVEREIRQEHIKVSIQKIKKEQYKSWKEKLFE